MIQLYRPAWWLPGPHLQTIWGRLFRRTPDAGGVRLTWETPDGDFLEVRRIHGDAGAPRLLLLHGLEGSERSHYARAFLHLARSRGWSADLLHFRSCGGTPNRTFRFYHSGETTDLDFAVRAITAEFPGCDLLIAGVSLGGNVLLKWLGERAGNIPPEVRAAAAISVPFDLSRSAANIHRGFARLYERVFLRSLVRKAASMRTRFPEAARGLRLSGITSLREFDDRVTAPVHGFAGAEDYYSRCSAGQFLQAIRIPTLLLSARDDPFLPREVLRRIEAAAENNPDLTTDFVERGGHVGFVCGRNPMRPIYYAEERACSFLVDASGLRKE